MPSKYFPFDSTFTGVDSNGIPQGDRGASSADWAAYVSRMFTDGYFKLLDDQLEPSISATPMAVDIAAGSAMIKGRQYSQDETVTVSLGLSDSQPRIDRVVLRMSTEVEDRKIFLKVLKGTPAASPIAPELIRTASVYDICLAQITVGASAIQVVADNLTDTRDDDALCGYVKLLLDGRYYPEGSIPELLWVYTMYPNTLTAGQKAAIESDTILMGIYEASNVPKIGDIVSTLRTDLSDDWLLCNGAEISPSTYPELAGLLSLPSSAWKSNAQGSKDFYSVAYGNGYWVAVGADGTLYYKADTPDGAWTSNTQGSAMFLSVAYGNGYWVAVGANGTLYYKSGNPSGSWSANNQGTQSLYSVAYGNGYWMATGGNGADNTYYKSSNPTGSWTKKTMGMTYTRFVTYQNGYWIVSGSSDGNASGLTYTNGVPSGTWSNGSFPYPPNMCTRVAYLNGFWVAIGQISSGVTNGIYATEALSSPFKQVLSTPGQLYDMFISDGYIVTVGVGLLYYACQTPMGVWIPNSPSPSKVLNGVVWGAGKWVIVGVAGALYATSNMLPAISGPSYSYIKAK